MRWSISKTARPFSLTEGPAMAWLLNLKAATFASSADISRNTARRDRFAKRSQRYAQRERTAESRGRNPLARAWAGVRPS